MLRTIILGLAMTLAASAAFAQSADNRPTFDAYIKDGSGNVLRSQSGLCWHSGSWKNSDAVIGCDGELVPPIANPTAPSIQAVRSETPAPVVLNAAPPKRCNFSVTLDNDQTFAFDRADLKDTAKQGIDNTVLKPLAACDKINTITITGHTDLLGSEQYNRILSGRRAHAVAAYLHSNGVAAPIDTITMGKSQPVKSCNSKLPLSAFIACLAPNRRVVIDVDGLAK